MKTTGRRQLVLQFPVANMSDYDRIVAYETFLDDNLPTRLARVDGHDVGQGVMNIFLYTSRPEQAFKACRGLVRSTRIASTMSAGHRPIDGDDYVRLWPPDSAEPFTI